MQKKWFSLLMLVLTVGVVFAIVSTHSGCSETCSPSCREGFECISETCTSVCNPACGSGFDCKPDTEECVTDTTCSPECADGEICDTDTASCVEEIACTEECAEGETCNLVTGECEAVANITPPVDDPQPLIR